MDSRKAERLYGALERFSMEIPSWGFANTGTRFGKFSQPAAATTIEEKFSDASRVHELTGNMSEHCIACAMDLAGGSNYWRIQRWRASMACNPGLSIQTFFRISVINTVLSATRTSRFANMALRHTKDSIEIARSLHSRDISIWFADGSTIREQPTCGSASAGSMTTQGLPC